MSDYAKLIKKMHELEREYITESFKSGNVKLNEADDYDFSDIDDRTLKGLLAEIKKLRKEVAQLKKERDDAVRTASRSSTSSYSSSGCGSSASYSSGCGSSSYTRSGC